jgi:HlyD family secretion protein
MIRKYVLFLGAVAGLGFAIWLVALTSKPVPAAQPVTHPSEAPFDSYVAGSGIIEASTENIAIGTTVAGIVTDLYVKPGARARRGDALFKIDDRALKAELDVRRTTLAVTKDKLDRLARLPRAEDIPPAEAAVEEAEASLADLNNQLTLYESVGDKRAVSQEELLRRRFAVQAAQARLRKAKAALTLLKAGTWKPDIEIAKAEVAAAESQIRAIETDIDRLTVRAPVDGEVLQVKVRLGEFAQIGVLQTPLILLGNVDRLHIRVDVDENDAWRIRREAPGLAFVRGNKDLKMSLKFVRIEPYVVPKKSLTGDSAERVDTRVLQILYSFERGDLPVYVGQQVDVFLEAPPIGGKTGQEPPEKRYSK